MHKCILRDFRQRLRNCSTISCSLQIAQNPLAQLPLFTSVRHQVQQRRHRFFTSRMLRIQYNDKFQQYRRNVICMILPKISCQNVRGKQISAYRVAIGNHCHFSSRESNTRRYCNILHANCLLRFRRTYYSVSLAISYGYFLLRDFQLSQLCRVLYSC